MSGVCGGTTEVPQETRDVSTVVGCSADSDCVAAGFKDASAPEQAQVYCDSTCPGLNENSDLARDRGACAALYCPPADQASAESTEPCAAGFACATVADASGSDWRACVPTNAPTNVPTPPGVLPAFSPSPLPVGAPPNGSSLALAGAGATANGGAAAPAPAPPNAASSHAVPAVAAGVAACVAFALLV
jgi:hypothetical protein